MEHAYNKVLSHEGAFEDSIKSMLMCNLSDNNLKAVKYTLESSDDLEVDCKIDPVKEQQVIEKLREKTGFKGIGLAGMSSWLLLLINCNMF